MKPTLLILAASLIFCALSPSKTRWHAQPRPSLNQEKDMQLGNFSVSLTVADLDASIAFYEKLGFKKIVAEPGSNYVIMQNATSTIGLFHGMFEKNILTFNPGWDRNAQPLDKFEDVRDIQRQLREKGIEPVMAADESTSGPASFVVVDPDGNPILVDQHVERPK